VNDDIEDDPFSEPNVGYCAPPNDTRFPHQRNANKRGRPGGGDRKKIIRKVLMEKIMVSIGGRPRRMTALEAVILKLRHRSAAGHRGAARLCDKYRGYTSIWDPEPPPQAVLIVPEELTDEEWEAEYAGLG
jgi:hypothetical protein